MFKKSFVLCVMLILVSALSFAELTITVIPDKRWGDAPTSNIKRLCENVALHFQEQLRDEYKIKGDLTIVYNVGNPITFFRSYFGGGPNEYRVGLSVTDTYWSQFIYQFAHEFTHIMHNHDQTPDSPNDWFEESICMLASAWATKQLGETWAYRVPYPSWVSYRYVLLEIFNDWILGRPEVQYDGTGAEWLREWEDSMRRDDSNAFTYARVAQLAHKFLPVFDEHPDAWNAVRQMPTSTAKMSKYMRIWYDTVDLDDKHVVKGIAEVMGITVESVVVFKDQIDADVNGDGYVDLYDVMIVRSGMRSPVSYDTDVNNDGVTDVVDLLIVKAKAVEAITAASPSKPKTKLTTWGAIKHGR